MKVFISWSGELSMRIAEVLAQWLKQVIQATEPYLSQEMDKGVRWSGDIARALDESPVGIICLTPDNLQNPWILFEAGALAKSIKDKGLARPNGERASADSTEQITRACTFLMGLKTADIEPPLSLLQATRYDEQDLRRLIKTINAALPDRQLDDSTLTESFDGQWPKLKKKLDPLVQEAKKPASDRPRTSRPTAEVLEELVRLVRDLHRQTPAIEPRFRSLRSAAVREAFQELADERDRLTRHRLEQAISPDDLEVGQHEQADNQNGGQG